MAITFDPNAKRIVLDSANVTVQEIFSRWEDWAAQSDNLKYLPAFKTVGGEGLLTNISIPDYFFLLNGWRVRPMEATHTLVIEGNLFVEGGGDPIVPTLGTFNVLIKSVVPMQAQRIEAAQTGITPTDLTNIQTAIWSDPFVSKILTVAKFLGLK